MKKIWLLAATIAFVLALNTFAAPVQVGVVETVEENSDQGYSEISLIDGVVLSEDIKFDFSSGEASQQSVTLKKHSWNMVRFSY